MNPPLPSPLTFVPLFQERAWGGRQLANLFGRQLPAGKLIGESWEIVDRPEAQSVVRQGPWQGWTLHELWQEHRPEIFGNMMPAAPRFPLLAKLLDARENLSLQVHPGPSITAAVGGEAKTEMWYFAASEAGAEIYAGLRRGVTPTQLERLVRGKGLPELVHRIPIKTGDAFFVPSGRLHAIGAGNLLIEIQENSDTTFRLFDWDRDDKEGRPRPLQIEEALQSIDVDDFEPEVIQAAGETLVSCPHFVVEQWSLENVRPASERAAFAIFICLSGAGEAGDLSFHPGDFFLVPALAAATALQPVAAGTRLLRVTLPGR
ncbi:MAG TPA: type I phosphomannose isomerase catalytic subunit [Chthoniobacterales bacterium]